MGSRVAYVILGTAVAVAAAGSLLLTLRGGGLHLSPDETANAFFAGRVASSGTLAAYDPLNDALGDALVPRSTVSIHGQLLPGSFIGLPVLYGSVAAVLGTGVLPFITPLIAAAAVFAWYGILRRFLADRAALVATLLTAFHPAWWYYSARSLMHNTLFVSLLLFSAYFLVTRPFAARAKARAWADPAAAGALYGLALAVRTSEAVWTGLVLLLAFLFVRKRVDTRHVAAFAATAVLVLAPFSALNMELYGNPLSAGYVLENADEEIAGSSSAQTGGRRRGTPVEDTSEARPADGGGAGQDLSWTRAWIAVQDAVRPLFPFGVHPRNMLRHFHAYGLSLFWWMSLLALLGFPLLVKRPGGKAYAAGFAFAGAWLVTLYGSWVIHDNPDPSAVTIGNSYVRYWLPLFVASTPGAALAVLWAADRARTAFARSAALAAVLLFVFGMNLHATFYRSEDSIVPAARNLEASQAVRARVLARTEPRSVIVVDRADKLFFPARRVRQPLRSEETYALMPRIAGRVPLYYYGVTFPPEDIAYLNGEKLKDLGLRITRLETFGIESLYRISPL